MTRRFQARPTMTKTFRPTIALALSLVCASQGACAAPPSSAPKNSVVRLDDRPYDSRDDVRSFARELAQTPGLDEAMVLNLLSQAVYQPSAAKAILPAASPNVKNWQRYRSRFVEPYRIRKGLEFWRNHADALAKAEATYGVPQTIIVAIIGVETVYGEQTGNYRTLDALTTLAFDYPPAPRDRSAFFRKELGEFFRLSREAQLDPLTIRGSYAGAIGLGQFMPSSWRQFAVDGSGDGRIDLFHNADDTIASVGNFLAKHGWVTGGSWVIGALVENPATAQALVESDVIPKFTAANLAAYQVKPTEPVSVTEKFALIDLPNRQASGKDDPTEYRLGPQNFFVITRYNRASFYALAVIELAQALQNSRNR